jgi:DNA-binding MarR family transcriptional regulator
MNCLCARTRQAARQLTRLYEEHLRCVNLTSAQFELLSVIAARSGISQSDLAVELSAEQSTLSRNLKILINRKWVNSGGSAEDRRQATYSLSPMGRKTWLRAVPHWQRAQDEIQEKLGSNWESVWSTIDYLSRAVLEN